MKLTYRPPESLMAAAAVTLLALAARLPVAEPARYWAEEASGDALESYPDNRCVDIITD
jgi:hypothetical protein